jgi:Acyl carrier protein phosphodiesterase
MAQLLYIEASPLKARSHSIHVASEFLKAYAEINRQDEIEVIDLWQTKLPPFDRETIEAKFAVLRKKELTPEQQARWDRVRAVSRRFNAAAKYVFSVPMWNFSIPYPLKHYIDVVTLAGENWSWSPEEGYRSLLSGKKALMIYASAGDYRPGDASDFQKPYLRRWLNFIGIRDIHEINVAPTLTTDDGLARIRCNARNAAVELAAGF